MQPSITPPKMGTAPPRRFSVFTTPDFFLLILKLCNTSRQVRQSDGIVIGVRTAIIIIGVWIYVIGIRTAIRVIGIRAAFIVVRIIGRVWVLVAAFRTMTINCALLRNY